LIIYGITSISVAAFIDSKFTETCFGREYFKKLQVSLQVGFCTWGRFHARLRERLSDKSNPFISPTQTINTYKVSKIL